MNVSEQEGGNLFDDWSSLNGVIADFRSRFDVLRDELPKCKSRQDAEVLLKSEGFFERYPVLPEWLPNECVKGGS